MAAQRWIMKKQDPLQAKKIAEYLGVSQLIAQLLINRGLTDQTQATAFLECALTQLADPFLMLDMDKAVARIEQALKLGQRIVIYGDYDVDGQTSIALLMNVLRELSDMPDKLSYYIPNRLNEGYGLNMEAIQEIAGSADLLVTVDCGIASVAEIELAKQLGLDVIITDHHQVGKQIPQAHAVLNPKQHGCIYPEKNLAGVGVAFRLAQALGQAFQKSFTEYLDLVAVGTVADLVPLWGENRVMVKHGLELLSHTQRVGLQALLKVSGVQGKPSAGDIGFRLGPRLNAVGRMGDPARGVRLLLSTDPDEAHILAGELDAENRKRQDVENTIYHQALEQITTNKLESDPGIVVVGDGWHSGVIGIVASRIVEKYYKPTVVVSMEKGVGTASGRSIAGFDLYTGLGQCAHLLERFGGHTMAAGLTIHQENIPEFKVAFNKVCAESLTAEDYLPQLNIDAYLGLNEVTEELISELTLLEPHGIGNPRPTLKVDGTVLQWQKIGKEAKHLRMRIQDKSQYKMPAIAFGLAEQASELEHYQENLSVAYIPSVNEWQNQRTLQMQVKAFAPGPRQDDYIAKWMERYPWELPLEFNASSFLSVSPKLAENEKGMPHDSFSRLDLRGSLDKVTTFSERINKHHEKTLILVNTPRECMEVCRQLRIYLPELREKIGFHHEFLSSAEREKFRNSPLRIVVDTGVENHHTDWENVWFWKPPLNESNYQHWLAKVKGSSGLALVFGPRDVGQLQFMIKESLPDRNGLARIYGELRKIGPTINYQKAQEYLAERSLALGLPLATKIFSELHLWDMDDEMIVFRPSEGKKLDLNSAVLYNKGMNLRRQCLDFLRHCLERGF